MARLSERHRDRGPHQLSSRASERPPHTSRASPRPPLPWNRVPGVASSRLMRWVAWTNRRLARRPVRSALALAVGAVVTYLCYQIGATLLAPTEGLSADRRSLV